MIERDFGATQQIDFKYNCSNQPHDVIVQVLRNMHDSVMQGLDGIQNNTAKVLQEQEKDLMRYF